MSADLLISLLIVLVLTFVMSKFIKISPKYDRKPKKRSPWQKLDQGDDPSVDE